MNVIESNLIIKCYHFYLKVLRIIAIQADVSKEHKNISRFLRLLPEELFLTLCAQTLFVYAKKGLYTQDNVRL